LPISAKLMLAEYAASPRRTATMTSAAAATTMTTDALA
jgi:hypothetical protein